MKFRMAEPPSDGENDQPPDRAAPNAAAVDFTAAQERSLRRIISDVLAGVRRFPAGRMTLRRDEAAEALGISPRYLDMLTRSGELQSIRIGSGPRPVVMYSIATLQRWLDKHEV